MNLYLWAARWNIPLDAVMELRHEMGLTPSTVPTHVDATTETGVQKRERLVVAQTGGLLWRNNVGALYAEDGRIVRYGLANESSQMNKKIKSSDLIGIQPIVITEDMVGTVIGQFVARETKHPGWQYKGTAREEAQLKFMELVISRGGAASFCS
jgi:hypothetical protein